MKDSNLHLHLDGQPTGGGWRRSEEKDYQLISGSFPKSHGTWWHCKHRFPGHESPDLSPLPLIAGHRPIKNIWLLYVSIFCQPSIDSHCPTQNIWLLYVGIFLSAFKWKQSAICMWEMLKDHVFVQSSIAYIYKISYTGQRQPVSLLFPNAFNLVTNNILYF